jgi:hypothetical protein
VLGRFAMMRRRKSGKYGEKRVRKMRERESDGIA